ncbi:MAG: hypothetical protein FJX45_12285 [Alphaproteobacteria bacterium]|nr:hypothetical protein [Alphaproteobacteria bacterium]
MRLVLINNGVVENVIIWEYGSTYVVPDGYTVSVCLEAEIGMEYYDGVFSDTSGRKISEDHAETMNVRAAI